MNILKHLKLGFTFSAPLSKRGKEVLANDWEAGYTIVEEVLKRKESSKGFRKSSSGTLLGESKYELTHT
ncbi:hypothetical protein [Pontibacter fetidus]|uniref:Uncharacterized protein n=1 Tax=Pontibacter fetidus TaxID=2700082 RepID=A0A6B2GV47_9BACT|nr:hypothetical protein [Pontibacter fetidus]NDK54779.1 hypothetical protein [Pontibacter fetidus]